MFLKWGRQFIFNIIEVIKSILAYMYPPARIESVNYHFTRRCNYSCGFCFHTDTTSSILSLEKVKAGLDLLKARGLRKLNLAGGEPFLYAKHIGKICKYAKNELKLESVSIVSNGSHVNEKWFEKYGQYLDILAISCDSADADVNRRIGRCEKNGKVDQVQYARCVAELCEKFGVMFKVNTVVNAFNVEEDMNELIEELNPFRWKVFQVLKIEGENAGSNA